MKQLELIMKKLCTAANPTEANVIKDFLIDHGIEADIQGEELWALRGELPITYPEIFVPDAQVEKASELVNSFRKNNDQSNLTPWTCEKCGENIEGQFTDCWNCQSVRANVSEGSRQ